jgi:hypothetical protein
VSRLRLARSSVIPVAVLVGLGTGMLLAGCSAPSVSASASPTPTRSASPKPSATPSATASSDPDAAGDGSSAATGSGTSADGSTGTGAGSSSGSGSGAATVDLAGMDTQAVSAAGGGTVVQATGSGDSWTILVAATDGSQTLAVVSASSMRVTSGPFPKSVDAATQASTLARIRGLDVDAAHAATTGVGAFGGSSLVSVALAGTDNAPQWSVGVTAGGTKHTVTVDGRSGAVVSTN